MSKYNTYEQIESYLYNKMLARDKIAFDAELRRNKVLAKKLKVQKIEHQILEAILENDLRKDLKEWDRELDSK